MTGNSGEVEADDSLGACRTYRAAVTDIMASALRGTGVSPVFHGPSTGETPVPGVWTFGRSFSSRGAEGGVGNWGGMSQEINKFIRVALHFEPQLADNVEARGAFSISPPFGQR